MLRLPGKKTRQMKEKRKSRIVWSIVIFWWISQMVAQLIIVKTESPLSHYPQSTWVIDVQPRWMHTHMWLTESTCLEFLAPINPPGCRSCIDSLRQLLFIYGAVTTNCAACLLTAKSTTAILHFASTFNYLDYQHNIDEVISRISHYPRPLTSNRL